MLTAIHEKMHMKIVTALLAISISITASAQSISFPDSDTPRVFAPGIISDGFANRDMAISPEGNDLFFTIQSFFQ